MRNYLVLFLSIFMLATAPVLVKLLSINPSTALIWRLLFVSVLLSPFALMSGIRISKTDVAQISIVSSVLIIHFYAWFLGVPKLPIGITVIIFSLNPIFTAILGKLILKEQFSYRHGIGIGICLTGICVIFLDKANINFDLLGMLEVLVASFFYSLYMVLSKRQRFSLKNSTFTFYLNFISFLLCLFLTCVLILFGVEPIEVLYQVEYSKWIYIFLLALLPSVLGHTLMIYSLPNFNLNFISCAKFLSPVFALLLGILVFNEVVTFRYFVGAILVFLGLLFIVIKKRSELKE